MSAAFSRKRSGIPLKPESMLLEKNFPVLTGPDALLEGVESRTSSPVRIVREPKKLTSNIEGIYPCGEGAGYAGGITSAAMDGIKVAEAVASIYALPVNKM